MPMRPKKSAKDLPPRMLRRTRRRVDGTEWVGYYYNGRDADGKRVEISLGTDLDKAKLEWARLECKPAPAEFGIMSAIFDRYVREILPGLAPKTQKNNFNFLKQLRHIFDTAPIDEITPQHIAQYRDHRPAKVSANREISLLSHIFNLAREWGYTSRENPVRGIRRNKEAARDYYIEKDVWDAVYSEADEVVQDAMDVIYFSGQRPGDALKMMETDIRDDALEVRQNKTRKRLRIMLNNDDGSRTEFGNTIDRIRARPRKVKSLFIVATETGQPLNPDMLWARFNVFRERAAEKAVPELAARIRQFQLRDIRARAATDIQDIDSASKLLGHTKQEMTKRVYRRKGEKVLPTR